MLAAMASRISTVDSAEELVAALGPAATPPRAAILIGGADSASPDELRRLRRFFERLAKVAERSGTAIVDGGTDSGVMRLIGEARDALGGTFRLVGVVPRGTLDRPTRHGDPVRLSPRHPEILLVPGSSFGDETAFLFGAADHLAGGPATTVVVNGGRLTMDEARMRLDAGHPVVTLGGSGRTADALAADPDLHASGKLRVLALAATQRDILRAIDGGPEAVEEV